MADNLYALAYGLVKTINCKVDSHPAIESRDLYGSTCSFVDGWPASIPGES